MTGLNESEKRRDGVRRSPRQRRAGRPRGERGGAAELRAVGRSFPAAVAADLESADGRTRRHVTRDEVLEVVMDPPAHGRTMVVATPGGKSYYGPKSLVTGNIADTRPDRLHTPLSARAAAWSSTRKLEEQAHLGADSRLQRRHCHKQRLLQSSFIHGATALKATVDVLP